MSTLETSTRRGTAALKSALLRDVLGILATGIVLGIAFNYLALSSGRSRGLDWIAVATALPDVEHVIRPAAPPSPPTSQASRTDAAPTHHSSPAPTVVEHHASNVPAAPAPTATPASTADPDSMAPLPMIPDVAGPLSVELSTAAKLIEANAALIVDARDAEEFAQGHIPGAVSVPYDEAVRDPGRIQEVDAGGRPTIVYCSGGTCEASRMLAEMLVRDFNRRRVLVYEGGFPEWVAAGKPVSRGAP